MQQFISLWQALDPRKRIIVAGATVAMFLAVYALAGVATKPSMALLYAGLDGARAGEVLAALDQRGAIYEVRGQSIYVQSPQRDALRMELASEGLPANSGVGYELLDSLSGFGTTSQMFDAAYWRAKEGELARTIAAMPDVRSARVHISQTEPQGFRVANAPKASVTVTTRGNALDGERARALRYLVSAAVAGMKPEDVAIIDGSGALIRSEDEAARSGDSRSEDLRSKVTRLLEARVGAGRAVVEVSLEAVTDSEAITERTIDPQSRVAISTETEEDTASASGSGGKPVTVASNLPTGDAAASGSNSQSTDSKSRERVNYEISETTREVMRAPGAVRRLTVAVLVDGEMVTDATGATNWQPRSEEELAALKDLVAAAVGFDEARGDAITIRTLAFQPRSDAGTEATMSLLDRFPVDLMSLVQLAVLAIVTLVLGLFVVKPILTSRRLAAAAPPALPQPVAALTGVVEEGEPTRPVVTILPRGRDAPPELTQDVPDHVERLRRLISERQDETAEILRSWMNEPVREGS